MSECECKMSGKLSCGGIAQGGNFENSSMPGASWGRGDVMRLCQKTKHNGDDEVIIALKSAHAILGVGIIASGEKQKAFSRSPSQLVCENPTFNASRALVIRKKKGYSQRH